jgi:hypothetical protein
MKKVPGPTINNRLYIKGNETILKVNKDGSKYVKTEIIKL